jgi:signal transduction histidine kinase
MTDKTTTNPETVPLPENPFQASSDAPLVITKRKVRNYHTVFLRIIAAFFLLSVIPWLISAFLSAAIYQSSVRKFLPSASIEQVEQVLIAQNLLILILVTILVIFASSLIAASVVRPLKRLVELTRLVGKGELKYRLQATSQDEVGELTDAFNTMVDQLQVQQTRERLISQMKSEFISIAAHQLRTPLSAVKWTLKMMSEGDVGKLTTEQQEFLMRGYEVNERMIALVNDLLNVARIEEGRFGYNFNPTDYIAYVTDYLERYKQTAASRNITIDFIPPTINFPKIMLDPTKMDLVLQNLLDNAVKYSKPGDTIVVRIKQNSKNQIETIIEDHGVGIPKHQIHRLFTKFFRGDNVIRMQTQGSGLGLFIVKNIVKNHGGDIRVESEENQGTKMIFTIPTSRESVPKKEITFEEFVGKL